MRISARLFPAQNPLLFLKVLHTEREKKLFTTKNRWLNLENVIPLSEKNCQPELVKAVFWLEKKRSHFRRPWWPFSLATLAFFPFLAFPHGLYFMRPSRHQEAFVRSQMRTIGLFYSAEGGKTFLLLNFLPLLSRAVASCHSALAEDKRDEIKVITSPI